MTREEQLACLKDRPCDVCKMRTDKGCSSWECVFEQTPDEEERVSEDCISFPKGTLKKRGKGYVAYNYAWLKENWQTELKVMGIECEDCISREEVCDYIAEFVNHEYATDRERELVKHIIGGIQHLPSIQPRTGHWKKTGFIDKVICDVCNKRVWDTFTDGVLNFQYCPNCGAKMLPTDSEKER